MEMHRPELLLLTPRGGVDNHRYVTWSASGLDSASCGRIYREAKLLVGNDGAGVGRLSDGSWFAAASHLVTQQEVAGRQGSEWLIFTDPRIEGLSDAARARLLEEIKRQLPLIQDEVLKNIAWGNHSGSDTLRSDHLDAWRRQFEASCADVPLRPADGRRRPTGGRMFAKLQPFGLFLGLAMIGGIVGFLVLLQVIGLPGWPPGKPHKPPGQRAERDLLEKAAKTLGVQPSEEALSGRLAGLFVDGDRAAARDPEELLGEIRGIARGPDRAAMPLLDDESFWKALEAAVPPVGQRGDLQAFLSESDREVVAGLDDPRGIRGLGRLASQFRDLDKDAARPHDQLLNSLYNGLCKCSQEVARIGEGPPVVLFTASDVRLAEALLVAFQDAGDDVERNTKTVSNKQQLAAWIEALGTAPSDGLYGRGYYRVALNVAEKNARKPQQESLRLLSDFCKECETISSAASLR